MNFNLSARFTILAKNIEVSIRKAFFYYSITYCILVPIYIYINQVHIIFIAQFKNDYYVQYLFLKIDHYTNILYFYKLY